MRAMIDAVRRYMFKLEDATISSSPTLRSSVLTHSDNKRAEAPKFHLGRFLSPQDQ